MSTLSYLFSGPGQRAVAALHGRRDMELTTIPEAELDRLLDTNAGLLEALKKIASCEKRADGDVVDIARAAIAKAKEG